MNKLEEMIAKVDDVNYTFENALHFNCYIRDRVRGTLVNILFCRLVKEVEECKYVMERISWEK